MELLNNTVKELHKAIQENNPEKVGKIHALTELLKVLTYSYTKDGKVMFNYENVDKVLVEKTSGMSKTFNSSCKSCQEWESKDRESGYCNMIESNKNDKFVIEDATAYRPALRTNKDFYCNLFAIHENVHLAGSDF